MDRLFRRQGREPARISPLDRLAFIGDRAMGALVFAPAQGEVLEAGDVQLLAIAQEVRKVMADDPQALLRDLALMGGSPHGARPKVLVNFDVNNGRMSSADQGWGTPWLVKFPAQDDDREVCAIEALYACLAAACGMAVPATRYFDLGRSLAAFGIERFDRSNGRRVPMLTMAGAMDISLQSSAGYGDLLRLTRHITRDEREVIRAFERCVFNVVFNNRDDHAKNFSFLLSEQGQWQVSPAYDLTFNEGPGGEHQMDVAGEGRAPGREHLLQLADKTAVPKQTAEEIMAHCTEVAGQLRQHAQGFAIANQTMDIIAAKVEANRKRMA